MRGVHPQQYGAPSLEALSNRLASLLARDDATPLAAMRVELVAILDAARDLEDRAERDPLTGAYNRHGLTRIAASVASRRRYTDEPLSALFIDIDRLKDLNRRHGHVATDGLLHAVTQRLRVLSQPYDTLVRWGGDEFVLLLPAVPLEEAAALAERIRASIVAEPFSCEGTEVDLSVSIGVADMRTDEHLVDLIRRISAKMYDAKGRGRNRIAEVDPHGVAQPVGRTG